MIVTANSVYLHNPKTAGTWLKYVLAPVTTEIIDHHIPEEPIPHNNVFSFVRNPWDWYVSLYLFLSEGSEKFKKTFPIKPPILQALEHRDFTSFIKNATIPTVEFKKKVYSTYKILKQIKPPQEPYLHQVRDPEGIILTHWLEEESSYYKIMCDMYVKQALSVGRYETLKTDLIKMITESGDLTDEVFFRFETTGPINVTNNKKDYRSYYTDETRKLVELTSQDIITQYDYQF